MSAAEIPRKIWTRAEFQDLSSNGLSLELVSGELIDRMGKLPPHVYWHQLLHLWLIHVFGGEYVRFEAPIDVAPEDNPHSEPQPDLIVTKQSIRESLASNPKPEDLSLVIEISDSTVWYDMNVKARLYAKAGIVEYWVVNIADKKTIIHTCPRRDEYTVKLSYAFEEEIPVGDIGLRLDRL